MIRLAAIHTTLCVIDAMLVLFVMNEQRGEKKASAAVNLAEIPRLESCLAHSNACNALSATNHMQEDLVEPRTESLMQNIDWPQYYREPPVI
jgi:hypothetical protein